MINSTGNVWNIMEDQRIERLFLGRYPDLAPYFRAIAGRLLLDDKITGNDYPLLGWRTYLPVRLRKTLRKAFIQAHGRETADKWDAFMSEYVSLAPTSAENVNRMVWIAYHAMLMLGGSQKQGIDNHGAMPADKTDISQPAPESEQKAAQEGAERKDKSEGENAPGEDAKKEEEEESTTNSPGKGEGEEDGAADDGGEADEPMSGGMEGENQPGKKEGESSNEEGDPAGESSKGDSLDGDTNNNPSDQNKGSEWLGKDDIKKMVRGFKNSTAREIARDEKVLEDFASTLDRMAMQRALNLRQATAPPTSATAPIKPASHALAMRCSNELALIRQQIESQWEEEQRKGRLHMRRVIRAERLANGDRNVMRRWFEGLEDDTRIETVVMVDESGSMINNDPENMALEAAWVIKTVAAGFDMPCTVLGFGDEKRYDLLYGSVESPDKTRRRDRMNVSGGTAPSPATEAALNLFRVSECDHKLLIILSDGVWNSGAHQAEKHIATMNTEGVFTVHFTLDGDARGKRRYNTGVANLQHNCQHFFKSYDAMDLVGVFQKYARHVNRNALT
jgi:hypothetical protein